MVPSYITILSLTIAVWWILRNSSYWTVELNILMEQLTLLGQYILAILLHGKKNVLPEFFRYCSFIWYFSLTTFALPCKKSDFRIDVRPFYGSVLQPLYYLLIQENIYGCLDGMPTVTLITLEF